MKFLKEWWENRNATLSHMAPVWLITAIIGGVMFYWGYKDPGKAITFGGIAAIVIVIIAVFVHKQRR